MPGVFLAKDGKRSFDEVDLAEVYGFELVAHKVLRRGTGQFFNCSNESCFKLIWYSGIWDSFVSTIPSEVQQSRISIRPNT